MSLRGKAAIVGIGETPHRRAWPGRTERGLCAEAAAMAIADAGLHKEDIDGLITFGGMSYPAPIAEYIGVKPTHFAAGVSMMGCSSGVSLTVAASAINAGLVKNVLCVFGGGRDPAAGAGIYLGGTGGGGPGGMQIPTGNTVTEFEIPYGKAVAANSGYGWLYTRHMHRYGTKAEQIALISVRQRFNTLKNPLSAFQNQPITLDDVMNSRFVNEPLHILECVMPVAGAAAFVVTSAEHAKSLPQKPVYLLGSGICQGSATFWMADDMLTMPAKYSAASAYQMAGYTPKDMQFAEFYD